MRKRDRNGQCSQETTGGCEEAAQTPKISHQRLTKPNQSRGCGSWLKRDGQEPREGGCAAGRDQAALVQWTWTGAGWSVCGRTEAVWESCAGRRCLESPVQSRDSYRYCFFF